MPLQYLLLFQAHFFSVGSTTLGYTAMKVIRIFHQVCLTFFRKVKLATLRLHKFAVDHTTYADTMTINLKKETELLNFLSPFCESNFSAIPCSTMFFNMRSTRSSKYHPKRIYSNRQLLPSLMVLFTSLICISIPDSSKRVNEKLKHFVFLFHYVVVT